MASEIYIITPTDSNTSRSFSISPYTSNGTTTPIIDTLDSKAVSANTSLLLFGKGSNDYGKFIQEDLLHLLENFSGDVEAVNPINGQIWYDLNDNVLKIFNDYKLTITSVIGNNITIKLPGTVTGTYQQKIFDSEIARLITGYKLNVHNILNRNRIATVVVSSVVIGANITEIIITVVDASLLSTTPGLESVGGWEHTGPLNTSNLSLTAFPTFVAPTQDLDAGGYNIENVLTPTDPSHAANKDYVDSAVIGGGVTSITIDHTIAQDEITNGDTLSSSFADDPLFPTIKLNSIIDILSKSLKNIQSPNRSGNTTLDDTFNNALDLNALFGINYTAGYNNLQIYGHGAKFIASTRGFQTASQTVPLPGNELYASNPTGLPNVALPALSFTIDVDIFATIAINIAGNTAQTYKELINQINLVLAGTARCVLLDGKLQFFSDTSGLSSSILAVDVDLFSSLNGTVLLDVPIQGVTNNYSEDHPYGDVNANNITIFASGLGVPYGGGLPIGPGKIIEAVVLSSGGLIENGFEL